MVLTIAASLAFGITAASPRERAPEAALLLAVLGAASGLAGVALARAGRLEEALLADMASVIFDLFGIIKALEVM